jgi:hypothetical protein
MNRRSGKFLKENEMNSLSGMRVSGGIAAVESASRRVNMLCGGVLAGLLLLSSGGRLYSESVNDRIAMILVNDWKGTIKVEFEHLTAYARPYSEALEMPETNGINRERKKFEMIIYSSDFGPTTRSATGGTEIELTKCRKDLCKDFVIREGARNSRIPPGGYVLSIDAESSAKQKEFVEHLKRLPKDRDRSFLIQAVFLPPRYADPNLTRRYQLDITNGVSQLVKNGVVNITWEQEKAGRPFVEMRHPRTAVAKLKDGRFLMMTVDGRQPGVSVGMSLQELAEYLFSLGATDAMNLDGGGSTTMFLNGRVINTPSDKDGERKVSDAILVTPRKKTR